jgi:hypothetical protein
MRVKPSIITVALLLSLETVNATAPVERQTIQVFISPECKALFYGPDIVGFQNPKPDYAAWNPALAKPRVFRDPRTSISFYVESDGRHLAARLQRNAFVGS